MSTGIKVISIAICMKNEMSKVVVKMAEELTDSQLNMSLDAARK